jgi:hypothetical protein
MVKLRSCAILDADFPDDQIEDDDDIIQFGGLNVTKAIAAIIGNLGYRVSEPASEGEQGWTFEVEDKEGRIWFQISGGPDDFLLLSEKTAGKGAVLHTEILSQLNVAFSRDGRFGGVLWYLKKELDAGFPGATDPAAADDPLPQASAGSGFPHRLMATLRHRLATPKVRPWAQFRSDIPDEQIEYHGQIFQFNGRNTARAIGEFFNSLGCFVSWPIPSKGDNWWIYASIKGQKIGFLVIKKDKYTQVFCKNPSMLRKYLSDDYKNYILLVSHLNSEMQRDPRFDDIRWYSRGRFQSDEPGAQAPV